MENELIKAKMTLAKLEAEYSSIDLTESKTLRTELEELKEILENGRTNEDTRARVMERLKIALRELEALDVAREFPKAKEELDNALQDLKITNERYGNSQTTKGVEQLEELAATAIKEVNIKAAKEIASQIRSFDFALADAGAGVAMEIGMIKGFDDHFDTYNWTNKNKARQLLNQAKQIIVINTTKQKLWPVVLDLFKLLPDSERPRSSEKDNEYLTL